MAYQAVSLGNNHAQGKLIAFVNLQVDLKHQLSGENVMFSFVVKLSRTTQTDRNAVNA
jgi:hypothetical protein